ncbi:2'-deoxycytidine 5'-triphosphate deaminase [Hyphobacterium marinum]|uniref:2'-deoxycytidine 5'-triphosphate deaminase n=1 Tax=Hyphobacterium marinum TaxID=3116574 RepID=A0ABU7LWE9_9PROT|nr:2'-deoxycytidine 5'-triphosphate deaminase [Hyphobacterium sp. Y6023]MEE2565871.1 2'-deoxycytidine 5'-triphosphate deaminase [Hyphobacterium sp. Y6023]
MPQTGILPDHQIQTLWDEGAISAAIVPVRDQIQPASADLRLGLRAYRLRASFLPGPERTVADCLEGSDLVMHTLDLSEGAVLETGCVYLVPLQEALALPGDISAAMNPKSSTGRLDVFTRVICDRSAAFDQAPAGYEGPLYVEICPRTFSILVRPGDRLVQVRFRSGERAPTRDLTVSVDLQTADGPVGYRARRFSGVVDLAGVGAHDPANYWEPIHAPGGRLVLDPGEFYILASREAVEIPMTEAAEMAPIAPEIGEFRAHYAGFFDPGFGLAEAGGTGGRAVLEVRGRDVPFLIEHGQPVARLVFEPMTDQPSRPYGAAGSHYQAQKLKLAKHFR